MNVIELSSTGLTQMKTSSIVWTLWMQQKHANEMFMKARQKILQGIPHLGPFNARYKENMKAFYKFRRNFEDFKNFYGMQLKLRCIVAAMQYLVHLVCITLEKQRLSYMGVLNGRHHYIMVES